MFVGVAEGMYLPRPAMNADDDTREDYKQQGNELEDP